MFEIHFLLNGVLTKFSVSFLLVSSAFCLIIILLLVLSLKIQTAVKFIYMLDEGITVEALKTLHFLKYIIC